MKVCRWDISTKAQAGDIHSPTHHTGLCIARGVKPFVAATQGFRSRIRGGSRQVWTKQLLYLRQVCVFLAPTQSTALIEVQAPLHIAGHKSRRSCFREKNSSWPNAKTYKHTYPSMMQ